MDITLILLILLIALATYFTRIIPLLMAKYKLGSILSRSGKLQQAPTLIGPCLIAGLLATAILPDSADQVRVPDLIFSAVALAALALVHYRYNNLGLSVLTGIFMYALLILIF